MSAPAALASRKEPRRPGTRIMSPKQVRMTPSRCAIAMPSSHPAHRDHAHRAARAVHELDGLGQVVLHAVAVDGVVCPPHTSMIL
jgi:hypothetical protein